MRPIRPHGYEGTSIMKKRLIALLACTMLACLALAACAAKPDPTPFVGSWELCEMESDGEVTSSDDLEQIRNLLGIFVYLDLNEDGTLALDVFGEMLDGTWEPTGATTAAGTFNGQDCEITLADGRLTLAQEGASMTFVAIDPSEKIDNAAALESLQEGMDELGVGEIADELDASE